MTEITIGPDEDGVPALVIDYDGVSLRGERIHGMMFKPQQPHPSSFSLKPREIEVSVLEVEGHGHGRPPTDLNEFAAWFDGIRAKIPEGCRAEIEFDATGDYDGGYMPTLKVSYWRAETPDEIATRVERAQQQQAAFVAWERAEFDRLKGKFGGSK